MEADENDNFEEAEEVELGAEQEEEEEQEEAKAKVEKKPQTQTQPKTIRAFFKLRAKNPKLYTFTEDGDLKVPAIGSQPETTMKLQFYQKASKEKLDAYDEERQSQLSTIETSFDTKLRELREAMDDWSVTGRTSRVLELQRELRQLDAQRTALHSPQRRTKIYKNPITRTIFFENRYDVRRIGYDVYAYKYQKYPDSILYEPTDAPIPIEKEVVVMKPSVVPGQIMIPPVYIYKPDNLQTASLSPYSLLAFDIGTKRYPSLAHAYEALRLTELDNGIVYTQILSKLKDPFIVKTKAKKIIGVPSDPYAMILNVVRAASRRKAFAEALRATGNAPLVFADPDDKILGVGLAANNADIEDLVKWQGENYYGKALMTVRKEIPQGELVDIVMEGGGIEDIEQEKSSKEKRKHFFIGLNRKAGNVGFQ